MGVHSTGREGRVAMYDSVTGIAFGPTFDSQDDLESFERYVESKIDFELRLLVPGKLLALHEQWEEERTIGCC